MLSIKTKKYNLELNHQFKISGYARTSTPILLIKLQYNNFIGFGEASFPQYLEDNYQTADEYLNQVELEKIKPENLQESISYIYGLTEKNFAIKAAFDIAIHDLYAKIQNKPLYQILGFEKSEPKATSFTIGISEERELESKIKEAESFKILKIKLGSEDDKKIIENVRKFTNKPLYVDINQGWTDRVFALEMIYWLTERGVEFIEQPLKVGRFEDSAWLTEHSPIPLIADESVKNTEDIIRLKGVFAGINVKLMKTGGISEAYRLIDTAKAYGMKIMLGCMTETSCAISAAASLMSLADWLDLDGNLLIKNDPFYGIETINGEIIQTDKVGIGVSLKEDYENLL